MGIDYIHDFHLPIVDVRHATPPSSEQGLSKELTSSSHLYCTMPSSLFHIPSPIVLVRQRVGS
jgi:hypothetical protein